MYVSLFRLLHFANKPIVGDILLLPSTKWSRYMPELHADLQVCLLPHVNADIVKPCPKFCDKEYVRIQGPMMARIDAIIVLDALRPDQEQEWIRKINSTQLGIVEMTILPPSPQGDFKMLSSKVKQSHNIYV
jgi:hypothetical protein